MTQEGSWQKEWASWQTPKPVETARVPSVGSVAPSSPKLQMPSQDGKPTIITFLRHCGCPFAEKTFIHLRALANKHPEAHFIAISHSDEASTDRWVISIGGEWDTHTIVDSERELYGNWGLGVSSAWHVLSPWTMYNAFRLGKHDNIWNKPTESGNRWQTAGSFAVDGKGIVRWTNIPRIAGEIPDFAEAMRAVELKP